MHPASSSSARSRPKPAPLAPGWAFVLEHTQAIERACSALCTDRRMAIEDLRQETCIRVARCAAGYDHSLAAPGTWIYFQARKARQDMLARRNRIDEYEALDKDATVSTWDVRTDNGHTASAMERAVLVAQVLSRAAPAEREACASVLADHDQTDIVAALCITPMGRTKRLAKLARALHGPRAQISQ